MALIEQKIKALREKIYIGLLNNLTNYGENENVLYLPEEIAKLFKIDTSTIFDYIGLSNNTCVKIINTNGEKKVASLITYNGICTLIDYLPDNEIINKYFKYTPKKINKPKRLEYININPNIQKIKKVYNNIPLICHVLKPNIYIDLYFPRQNIIIICNNMPSYMENNEFIEWKNKVNDLTKTDNIFIQYFNFDSNDEESFIEILSLINTILLPNL
jgi:hypothetical protein